MVRAAKVGFPFSWQVIGGFTIEIPRLMRVQGQMGRKRGLRSGLFFSET